VLDTTSAVKPRRARSAAGAMEPPGSLTGEPTLVSLTFDDASGDQYAVRPLLAAHAMRASFYVNSGRVGTPDVMTWDELANLAADGHEIGGHTLDHVKLTSVSRWEARRQISRDREALIARGFRVASFAYPYGDYNPKIESIVRKCGYITARRSWGLRPISAMGAESTTPVLESCPPQDLWATRTLQSIRTWHSLADIVATITRAEAGGVGWVTLVFHHVCDRAADQNGYSVDLDTLAALLDWLDRRAAYGTYVRTVQEVVTEMRGAVRFRARDRRWDLAAEADIAVGS
jgi:peptidoglycan/xylan/chitin deacetylase (PgdA/CDA1 family)